MEIKSIASSSSGNCTYIKTKNAGILIDSGGPGTSMKKIIEVLNGAKLDAIFITHEHGDHMGAAAPLARKLKIPIYMHKESYQKYEHDEWFEKFAYNKEDDILGRKPKFNNCNIIFIDPTKTYTINDISLTPFSTPHDAAYSLGFVIEDLNSNKKLGYLTDCGSFTKLMELALKGCDAYMIEADYDYDSLWNFEEYDELLKQRIDSNVGHLSNDQTMGFLEKIGIEQAKFVVFCHLSTRTNSPEKVLQCAKEKFPNYNNFYVAPMEEVFTL